MLCYSNGTDNYFARVDPAPYVNFP